MPPSGTVIEIEVPPPIPSDLTPENIPLEILFEDSHLLIINKPQVPGGSSSSRSLYWYSGKRSSLPLP